MLFVERSNRTERLLEGVAHRLMAPGHDPLAPSVVVVQGSGMERWIAQSIASKYGICANTSFPFPRGFLDQIFAAMPDPKMAKPNADWDCKNLTWRIARLLADGKGDPDYAPLARHLHSVDADWRLIQLAHRIAILLDQYITYRPDWISAWTKNARLPEGRDERWQARLVREIHLEVGGGHLADRALAFVEAVGADASGGSLGASLARAFPRPIEFFAVSTLPPLYMSAINALAVLCDVHLSVLSPSRHYWADLWREIRDDGINPASVEGSRGLFDLAATTPAGGLLAGLGRLASDFQRSLEAFPEIQDGEGDLFESPCAPSRPASLLERLQSRILDLDDGEADEAGASRIVRRDDDSIRIHVCHGARREIEVVHAALRAAFERDETLTPEDVLVMAPSIDEIAPEIVAVFGAARQDSSAIPFRIADRGVFRRSPVAVAYRDLLGIIGGRANRSEILDWLAREPVRGRFDLDERAVEMLSEWAERAGIRFGLDEDDRERLGLARERAHTWSGGLDRLALAHAVGACDEVFEGLSPTPLDALGDSAWLGALGDVDSLLRDAMKKASTPRGVADWCRWLRSLLERTLFENDSNAHEHAMIRGILDGLRAASGLADFDRPIPFAAIRERVVEAVESSGGAQPFLSGGVTFCELVPLRAIPFRVIVTLGLSDAAFPRGGPAAGFDLMARDPRAGDRTKRNDDRTLFLEALLSARDQLIVTVPGRDVRDGADLPPSVVVSELIEMLESSFELEASVNAEVAALDASSVESGNQIPPDTLRDWLVVAHPLQSSNACYFEQPGDSRLRGSDANAFSGAKARRFAVESGGGPSRRFLTAALDTSRLDSNSAVGPTAGPIVISLESLVERLLRSTRFFSRERLHLRLPRPENALGDLDPIDLDPLLTYGLGNALLIALQRGESSDAAVRRLLANASIPAGFSGELALRGMRREVEEVARIGHGRRGGEGLEDIAFELDFENVAGRGACRLVGVLNQLWPSGRIELAFTRVGRRAELDLWIRHLVLCALVEEGADLNPTSVFIGRAESSASEDRVVLFNPVAEPRVQLARLLDWAESTSSAPLPFFPRASRAFASKSLSGKVDQAWRDAHQQFEGGEGFDRVPPEFEEELEMARIWEGDSPLDSTGSRELSFGFDELAEQFFEAFFGVREVHRE